MSACPPSLSVRKVTASLAHWYLVQVLRIQNPNPAESVIKPKSITYRPASACPLSLSCLGSRCLQLTNTESRCYGFQNPNPAESVVKPKSITNRRASACPLSFSCLGSRRLQLRWILKLTINNQQTGKYMCTESFRLGLRRPHCHRVGFRKPDNEMRPTTK